AAVGIEEHRAHAGMAGRTDQPRHVAVQRLHLDHVGAVVAEHLGRVGAHQHGRHVDDLDALQWAHGVACSRMLSGPRKSSARPRSRASRVWGYAEWFPLVIASEAKQSSYPLAALWIASSLRSSQ